MFQGWIEAGFRVATFKLGNDRLGITEYLVADLKDGGFRIVGVQRSSKRAGLHHADLDKLVIELLVVQNGDNLLSKWTLRVPVLWNDNGIVSMAVITQHNKLEDLLG